MCSMVCIVDIHYWLAETIDPVYINLSSGDAVCIDYRTRTLTSLRMQMA